MSKPLLIGIHGKARSGKDTIANYLIKKYKLLRFGPSVPVKDATAAMFNIPRWYLDDDKMKDEIDPYWGISYRQMAQKVGKESSRDVFGNDFWMRHVDLKWRGLAMPRNPQNDIEMDYTGGMILADIRYSNEPEWIKERGGCVIFIQRDNRPEIRGYENHEGERGLDVELADILLYNNGTIEELYQNVERQLAAYYTFLVVE